MAAIRPLCPQHRLCRFVVDDVVLAVIQGSKLEPRIMRYELSNYGWGVIKLASTRIWLRAYESTSWVFDTGRAR